MTDFTGAKVLVVGGAGFVGSNLCHRLVEYDIEQLIVVDNLLSAEKANLPNSPKLTFIEKSINDDAVLENIPADLDYAFHLATYHGNQSSIADPLADHEHNTLTSLKLFNKLATLKSVKKVVYAGAGCTVAQKTFDKAKATTEEDAVSLYLDSPYQMSKIFGEFYGNYYFAKYDMPFVKARFQNVYGPREILGAGQWRGTVNTVWRNVIPTFIFKALHEEALPLENEGIATRDFIYVNDLVTGLVHCALVGETGGVYNLASGVETSIRELADTINRITKNPTPPEIKPARHWDRSGKRFADTAKSERELNFKAKVQLEEGIGQTIEWIKNNLEFFYSCITRHRQHASDIIDKILARINAKSGLDNNIML